MKNHLLLLFAFYYLNLFLKEEKRAKKTTWYYAASDALQRQWKTIYFYYLLSAKVLRKYTIKLKLHRQIIKQHFERYMIKIFLNQNKDVLFNKILRL